MRKRPITRLLAYPLLNAPFNAEEPHFPFSSSATAKRERLYQEIKITKEVKERNTISEQGPSFVIPHLRLFVSSKLRTGRGLGDPLV